VHKLAAIKVRLHGYVQNEINMEIKDGATLKEMLQHVIELLRQELKQDINTFSCIITLNNRDIRSLSEDIRLHDGDVISFFLPIGGG